MGSPQVRGQRQTKRWLRQESVPIQIWFLLWQALPLTSFSSFLHLTQHLPYWETGFAWNFPWLEASIHDGVCIPLGFYPPKCANKDEVTFRWHRMKDITVASKTENVWTMRKVYTRISQLQRRPRKTSAECKVKNIVFAPVLMEPSLRTAACVDLLVSGLL